MRAVTFALAVTALSPSLSWSQIALKPIGSLWIEGDSTLHRWSSTSTAVEMSFTLAEGATDPAEAVESSSVKSAEARVPSASLKSGDNGLDKNMRRAMNAEKFPEVLYKLVSYTPAKSKEGGVMTVDTKGELSINGRTQVVTIGMEFVRSPEGLRARGAYALKMSDYGIPPPKLMLGTIKVRDLVTIRFDLTIPSKKD